MSFNIETFRNNFRPGRSAFFDVTFTLPAALNVDQTFGRNLTFHASTVNKPAVSFEVTSRKRYTTSYLEHFPTNVTFGDLNISFLCDEDGKVLDLFDRWMNLIFPTRSDSVSKNNFRVAYKSEYVAPAITITHYSAEGKATSIYTYEEAFPESISDVSLSWGSIDDALNLQVQFKYKSFYKTNDSTRDNNIQGNVEASPDTLLPRAPIIV